MSYLISQYFGRLDKSSCVYFLIVSGLFAVLLIFVIFAHLIAMIRYYKNLNVRLIAGGILLILNVFLSYFVNRLFYSMCSKSLA